MLARRGALVGVLGLGASVAACTSSATAIQQHELEVKIVASPQVSQKTVGCYLLKIGNFGDGGRALGTATNTSSTTLELSPQISFVNPEGQSLGNIGVDGTVPPGKSWEWNTTGALTPSASVKDLRISHCVLRTEVTPSS